MTHKMVWNFECKSKILESKQIRCGWRDGSAVKFLEYSFFKFRQPHSETKMLNPKITSGDQLWSRAK